jgi:Arc/MetJ-type ribon-helix-helix transcriptional regulator
MGSNVVLSVEISGILEERLRRLVDLGVYASVAEAVREAVRLFLKNLDLKKIAMDMYVKRRASFQYATEFADETYDVMIDYMLSRGVMPLIGAIKAEDSPPLYPGTYILDSLTLYTIYKSGLVDLLKILKKKGYRFLALSDLGPMVDVLEARRLARGLSYSGVIEFVSHKASRERKGLYSINEIMTIDYASRNGARMLSDDARTRELARGLGVEAYSSASVLATLVDELEEDKLLDYVYDYRSVPCLLPSEVVERWRRR